MYHKVRSLQLISSLARKNELQYSNIRPTGKCWSLRRRFGYPNWAHWRILWHTKWTCELVDTFSLLAIILMGISVFLIKLPVLPLQNRTTRSARRSRTYFWPNGIVRYRFHSNVDSDTREKICKAISKWEAKTCLKFRYRISLPCFRISLPRFRITQSDYIEFTADDSNSVFWIPLARKVENSEFNLDLRAGLKELSCMRLAMLLVYGMN